MMCEREIQKKRDAIDFVNKMLLELTEQREAIIFTKQFLMDRKITLIEELNSLKCENYKTSPQEKTNV